jgi:hypothetical protein
MVVYDIVVNGELKETIRPINQRLKDMYWYMIDQMDVMRGKYEGEIKVFRRNTY